jgi:EAL domain-containing protein (putative c-di-GMP-specific phosphodiesterase class I)
MHRRRKDAGGLSFVEPAIPMSHQKSRSHSPPSPLRAERDRFVAFAFAAADLLIEVDTDESIIYAAGAARRLCGRDADALPGQSVLDLLHADDHKMYRSLVSSIRRGGRFVPTRVRLAGREQPDAMLGGCTLPGAGPTVYLALSDATRLAEKNAGGTTPLPKDEFLAAAEKLLQGDGDDRYKLSFVAVDGLTSLRDRVPDLGEGIVTAVERQLQSASADVEIVGQVGDGRYGLVHRSQLDAEDLQRQVEGFTKSVDPAGTGLALRSSTIDLDTTGLNEGDAARALVYAVQEFASKGDTGFTLTSLRGSLNTLVQSAAERIAILRTTVDTGAFDLAVQPIVDFGDQSVHHLEALARFARNSSTGGMVAFAEASGLITDFDLAVLQRVLALLGEARTNGVPIAVNVSGRSLESKVFCVDFEQLLSSSGVPSRLLLIEITESAAVTNIDEVNQLLQSLRSKGYRVCLDDFGAGASSFHYARGFEVDFIKIDGNFAQAAMEQPRDRALLHRVVEFCRDIGVQVIVEMIETDLQAKTFRRMGARFGQGYLLGEPDSDIAKFTAAARAIKPPIGVKRRGFSETWM